MSGKFCMLFFVLNTFVVLYYYSSQLICINEPNNSYTHVIVGAGTSGCVLAARLSANKHNKVLLVEAGGHFNIFSKVPLFATFLQRSKHDWSYETTEQQWSSKGFHNRKQFLPRGKGLGGSGQMNYMIHHGVTDQQGLNLWEAMGARVLKQSILKYFIRSKGSNGKCKLVNYLFLQVRHTTMCDAQRLNITTNQEYQEHLEESTSILGHILRKSTEELNNLKITHYPCLSTIFKGQRWSTFNKYLLQAIQRENLHVLCNTEVIQILFENKRAAAIRTTMGNRLISSESEIVICAGAINTPKLLLQSGIGNATILNELDIPVVVDLPGVGLNLHDHIIMPLYVSINDPISLTINKILDIKEFYNYFIHGKGTLAKSPIAGIVKTSSHSTLKLFNMGSTDENIFQAISNYLPATFKQIFPYYNNFSHEGFVFLTSCAQPRSRGFVGITSNNLNSKIVIDPRYLMIEEDAECMKQAVKLAINLLNTTPFKSLGAKIHWPELDQCKEFKVDPNNDQYLECIIRCAAITSYHLAGTCKMGKQTDNLSVVDNMFRVKGVAGLRIVDASILPTPLASFPNSILVAISEYASDLMLLY